MVLSASHPSPWSRPIAPLKGYDTYTCCTEDSVFLHTKPIWLQYLEYQASAVSVACFEPIALLVYLMNTYLLDVSFVESRILASQ